MNEYGAYFNNIYAELKAHLSKHGVLINDYYRKGCVGKEPSYIKKHSKLIELYWRACGMWKKGDRG